ncbi:hypothetical protein QBC42DRAFT_297159 [Cladorrhinum samala]|uniref:DUF7721 domain-containing protein n=1 Tax=Cladorrhinum samala TaxID=585594 RepID=A0AAV9HQT2_9PEZI|nr:hypothetical protein QBC42DRAFT_297159 [Cladorrhinum samala]
MDFLNQAKDSYFNRPRDDDSDDDENDLKTAAKYAAVNTDNDADDKTFFKGILGHIDEKKDKLEEEDIDEEEAITSHRSLFSSAAPTPSSPSSSLLGSAAALEALKLFNSSPNTPAPATPQSQNAFIGLAMAQAAKLFDQKSAQGQVSPGADKQSAVMKAGELALKMYMKGNKGGSTGTGGLGGLGAAGLVGAYLSGGGNKKDGSGGGLGGIAAELLSGATQGGSGGKQGGGSGSGGLLGSVGKLF